MPIVVNVLSFVSTQQLKVAVPDSISADMGKRTSLFLPDPSGLFLFSFRLDRVTSVALCLSASTSHWLLLYHGACREFSILVGQKVFTDYIAVTAALTVAPDVRQITGFAITVDLP